MMKFVAVEPNKCHPLGYTFGLYSNNATIVGTIVIQIS